MLMVYVVWGVCVVCMVCVMFVCVYGICGVYGMCVGCVVCVCVHVCLCVHAHMWVEWLFSRVWTRFPSEVLPAESLREVSSAWVSQASPCLKAGHSVKLGLFQRLITVLTNATLYHSDDY